MKYLTMSSVLRCLTAGMLFAALLPQNFDFFELLRWTLCFTGAFLIYVAMTTKNHAWIFFAVALILLFNPIKPLRLRKQTWQLLDILSGIGLLISIFFLGEKLSVSRSLSHNEDTA